MVISWSAPATRNENGNAKLRHLLTRPLLRGRRRGSGATGVRVLGLAQGREGSQSESESGGFGGPLRASGLSFGGGGGGGGGAFTAGGALPATTRVTGFFAGASSSSSSSRCPSIALRRLFSCAFNAEASTFGFSPGPDGGGALPGALAGAASPEAFSLAESNARIDWSSWSRSEPAGAPTFPGGGGGGGSFPPGGGGSPGGGGGGAPPCPGGSGGGGGALESRKPLPGGGGGGGGGGALLEMGSGGPPLPGSGGGGGGGNLPPGIGGAESCSTDCSRGT
jgi:hypothetical protein